jgi:hypothetical protein
MARLILKISDDHSSADAKQCAQSAGTKAQKGKIEEMERA